MNLSADFEFASRLQNEEYSVMNDSALASLIQVIKYFQTQVKYLKTSTKN